MQITTIGLDIAKNVFQVHGIDATEKVVVRKQLRRSQMLAFFKALPPCLVGMEACATAHYWARELTKLGHQVRLMPAKDVKAYVKRNKNDAADAEAICEAVRRPTMRFVQVKSAEQQGQLMLHRTRDLLMRQRTQVINALRAHLAELGIVSAQGREGIKELLKIIASEQDARLPVDAHTSLVVLAAGLQAVQTMIGSIENPLAPSDINAFAVRPHHPKSSESKPTRGKRSLSFLWPEYGLSPYRSCNALACPHDGGRNAILRCRACVRQAAILAIELIENVVAIRTEPGLAEPGDSQRPVIRKRECFCRLINHEHNLFFPC